MLLWRKKRVTIVRFADVCEYRLERARSCPRGSMSGIQEGNLE
uniref:Uncharacterized protein n=1 Tax=Anguilla anguilla TaxID=7936 RepID=A0A0E9VAI4_ANGAN